MLVMLSNEFLLKIATPPLHRSSSWSVLWLKACYLLTCVLDAVCEKDCCFERECLSKSLKQTIRRSVRTLPL